MPETLEAEIIEIDGKPPEPAIPEESGSVGKDPFRHFRGRVLKLDRRWWPLWAALGLVFGVVLLALAIVAGFCYAVFVLLRSAAGLFFGGLSGDRARPVVKR